MHINLESQPSCARAWVAAASAIARSGEGYNVIIGVDDPLKFDVQDNRVVKLVDTFLREHKQAPISTVVNTIFPSALYRKFGAESLVAEYRKVYDRLTTKRWGRYFDRMTRRVDADGTVYDPLEKIIEKLKSQNSARTPFKAAYELPINNPDSDRKKYRDAPCLSFLSFKRHSDRRLSLTATYRNHTYITRCLGNLIGLGRLQAFVAKQADLTVGPLTCISTHAEIDKGDDKVREKRWGIVKARALIQEAAGILAEQAVTN
jgi:thymidylate synthase